MQTVEITENVVLVIETCCVCGTYFGMEESLQHNRKQHGITFYCPNGHRISYTVSVDQKLEETKRSLRMQEEQTEWWKEQAKEKAKQLSTTKGQLTKAKKRIANGVCPCCNRSFVNLQQHMNTKHPDYAVG